VSRDANEYRINYYDDLNFAETRIQDRAIHINYGGNAGTGTASVSDIPSSTDTDGAPFPRRAYNSGRQHILGGQYIDLRHNVGKDVDDYVVDFQMRSTTINV
jgi:hypothetical protein